MKKILIIEDEEDIISLLKFRISNWGYYPLAASSGREAFKLMEEEIPDLILLDVMMPEMDGFEFLKKLKASEKTRTIPVIIITVVAAHKEVEKGLALGANFYLTKPYDAQELQNKIIQLVGEGYK